MLVAPGAHTEAVQLEGEVYGTVIIFLDSLRHSTRDRKEGSSKRITCGKTSKRNEGHCPLLYWLMERTRHELLQQKFVYVDADGKPLSTEFAKLYKQKIPAVWVSSGPRFPTGKRTLLL